MRQCRTWDADGTIGCYYGDQFMIPTFTFNFFLPHT